MSQRAEAKVYELIGILKADQGNIEGAIDTFTAGIAQHPEDARLYRHRAHRYMNVRRLEEAKADFLKALELLPRFQGYYETARSGAIPQLEAILLTGAAPDSQPDIAALKEVGQYYASLEFKIYYHLGLTHHLLGENQEAVVAFERALEYSETVDLKSATLNWLVAIHGLLGNQTRIAELLSGLQFEQTAGVNGAYQEMLKVYKGLISIDELVDASNGDPRVLATSGYGLATLMQTRGDADSAKLLLERVVAEGDRHAFGTVAAEIRLKELQAV